MERKITSIITGLILIGLTICLAIDGHIDNAYTCVIGGIVVLVLGGLDK